MASARRSGASTQAGLPAALLNFPAPRVGLSALPPAAAGRAPPGPGPPAFPRLWQEHGGRGPCLHKPDVAA